MSLNVNNIGSEPKPSKVSFAKVGKTSIEVGGIITGAYQQVASSVTSFYSAVAPFIEGAKAIQGEMTHVSLVGFAATPFQAWETGGAIAEAALAPGLLKGYPSLKVISGVGGILDSFVSLIGGLEQTGSIVLQNSSAILAPLGMAAVVLQGAGIGVSAWHLHELNKQWEKVEKLLGKAADPNHEPTKQEYEAAVQFLTDKPTTKTEKFKRLFFGVINDAQQKKVRQIFDLFQNEGAQKTIKSTFDELKKRHIEKKVQSALTIALLILAAVGLLILLFAPTPIAPIAWGIVGGVTAISIGVVAYNFFANRRFNNYLNARIKSAASIALTTK